MNSKYDLHIHTLYSDGLLSPLEIIKESKKIGLKGIAITDHESINGFLEAEKKAKELNLDLIPGVEIQGLESEILGYCFNKNDNNLNMLLEKHRIQRKKYLQKKIEGLENFGINISFKEVLEKIKIGKNPNTFHIAQLLIEKGYCQDIDSVYKEYLNNIRVRLDIPPTRCKKIIKVIIDAGGKAVMPHPWYLKDFQKSKLESFFINLIKEGLIGIEVNGFIPEDLKVFKNKNFMEEIFKITKKYELIETGGSDFHGISVHKNCILGKYTVSKKIVDLLKK